MLKRYLVGVFLCLLTLSTVAFGQESTGGIQGTVKDPQGAVIPGATIEVTSPALIGKKTATTDAGGFFRFDLLPPGAYSLTVNAKGFAAQTQNGLDVRTGALPTINNTMNVGEIGRAHV